MPKPSMSGLVRDHLAQGDTPERQRERIAAMAVNEVRANHISRLATLIHEKLGRMDRREAGLHGEQHGSPRMSVRHIGNHLYGTARGWHCHAGIYRTRGAHDLLTRGGLDMTGNAVVHCEHTIPSSLMVDLMWRMRQQGAYPTPRDLLAWLLRHSVVTVALQSERKAKGQEPVALGRERTIAGVTSAWGSTHPDLADDTPMSDDVRPFVRYEGTGAEIIHWPTGEIVDLHSTMAEHFARIAHCPIHAVDTYLPEQIALAA